MVMALAWIPAALFLEGLSAKSITGRIKIAQLCQIMNPILFVSAKPLKPHQGSSKDTSSMFCLKYLMSNLGSYPR